MIQRLAAGLVYSNIFVGLVLSSLSASTYFILSGIEFRWYVPLTLFFGSHMLYCFHRLYKIDFIPEEQLESRHRWILQRANPMKYSMMASMLVIMVLVPNFDADTVIYLIPAGLISVGYTIPIIPSEDGWRRFRDIPFTKPLIISLVVTYFTLCFPVFEQSGFRALAELDILRACSERILFLLAVTVPFEMRDLKSDQSAGLETLATYYGYSAARGTGYIVIGAWIILMAWQVFRYDFAIGAIAFPLVMLALMIFAYRALNESRSDLFYVFTFEGLILVYSALWSWLGAGA